MITHKFISLGIFSSRWLQAPLYLGLIGAQGFYVYRFMQDIFHLFMYKRLACEAEVMLAVLSLIDMVMVSNLLIMVIVGGYETFVSRLRLDDHPDIPEWLDHVNANTMKIKLSMAIVGISSIHLLKTFIEVSKMSNDAIMWQVLIHITFLLSSLALAYTAKVTDALHRHGLAQEAH